MGQRILITEEERSRIKNLYEVSTPPPSESVLVTNKNPFKYPEFEDARRIYSPELKDGDRFYQTKPFLYNDFFQKENSPFRILYNSFIGKTIRIPSDDRIVKIENVFEPIHFNHHWLSDINNNSIELKVKIDYFVYSINYDSKTNSIKILRLSSYGYSSPSQSDELLPVLSSIANKLKTTYIDYFKDLTQIPDELFEIRKIQRETTDF